MMGIDEAKSAAKARGKNDIENKIIKQRRRCQRHFTRVPKALHKTESNTRFLVPSQTIKLKDTYKRHPKTPHNVTDIQTS